MDSPFNHFPAGGQMNNIQKRGDENVWIETKAADGKCYFYHSRTRQTSWTRPDNAVILTQEQFNASIRQHMPPIQGQRPMWPQNPLLGHGPMIPTGGGPQFQLGHGMSVNRMPLGNPNTMPLGTGLLPPPNSQLLQPQHQLPLPLMSQPPPSLRPPIPQLMVPTQVPTILGTEEPAKATSILLQFVDPEIRLRAAEWNEYKTPDGRAYFFSNKSKESVWEKPKALIDMEEALETAKKNQDSGSKNGQSLPEVRVVSEATSADTSSNGKETETTAEPKDKTKPISSTPVSGTPWCVVWTGDMKVFFYNPSTKTSIWERPHELKGRPDVDKLLKGPQTSEGNGTETPASNSGDSPQIIQDEDLKRKPDVSEDSVVSAKIAKLDAEQEKENNEEPVANAEAIVAKQRETLPIEERIDIFKQMLAEKDVSAFSTWEKELHKIVFDPRYLLITSKERKVVFDDYVRDRADKERQEKRNQFRIAREDFRNLLEEAKISSRTSFNEFCLHHGKDERFKKIEKMRERETLFTDFLTEIRRREREKMTALRDQTCSDFNQLLKESHKKKPFSRGTKWSEVKDSLRDDPRYKNVDSSSDREQLFRAFIAKNAVPNDAMDSEDEEDLKERQKKERMEKSLREREREVAKELSTHLRERDKEVEKQRRADAVEAFTALLIDIVRSDGYCWRDARHLMKKDKRMDLCDCLDRDEQEKLFNEHIDKLMSKKRERFRECLSEVKGLSLTSNWREIRRQVKDDVRYLKFSASDRKCEREFREFLRDKLQAAKNEFKAFLKETKILTHKSKKLIEESDQHLQDIIAVLQNDQRYLVLDCVEDERREILMAYVNDLEQRGPPPPPTASEPQLRKQQQQSSTPAAKPAV